METKPQATTTVTIAYTTFEGGRGDDDFETARDVRVGMDDVDDLEPEQIDGVYDDVVSVEIDADVDDYDIVEFLEGLNTGIEQDLIADLDRTEYRSLMVGDVVVVRETAFAVAPIGFQSIETAPRLFE